jgi:hypothetical protein
VTDLDAIRLIERDRNERESALAALLLLLSRNARRAMRAGLSTVSALRRYLLGPGVPVVANAMASAATAGVARVYSLVGLERPAAGLVDALAGTYEPRAVAALQSSVRTLAGKVTGSLAVAAFVPVPEETAILRAFQAAGWTDAHDRGARTAAGEVVLAAYAEGMSGGYASPAVFPELTALRYITVHDANRTNICTAYDRVQLPPDDIWWDYHWPKNHFGCRSVVLPRTIPVRFTENPPWVPAPMAGFGRRPGINLRAA